MSCKWDGKWLQDGTRLAVLVCMWSMLDVVLVQLCMIRLMACMLGDRNFLRRNLLVFRRRNLLVFRRNFLNHQKVEIVLMGVEYQSWSLYVLQEKFLFQSYH